MNIVRTLVLVVAVAVAGGSASAVDELIIGEATTAPGSTTALPIFLSHDGPVQGFQTALTYDNTLLTLHDVTFDGLDLPAMLQPDTVEFFLFNVDDNVAPLTGWGAAAALFDSTSPFNAQVLMPGTNQSILNYHFEVVNDPALIDTSIPVTFENGYGPPPGINNVITVNQTSIFPDLFNGQINIVDQVPFIRADVNGDSVVNIADGVFLIIYLFSGGPAPLCFASGDANLDGGLDISDMIFILFYQFLGGPPPAAPFPGCGVPPVPGTLDCANGGSC